MNTTPKPGQIAILAGGAVLLIFSFFTWFSFGSGQFSSSDNAWSDFGLFTWPAFFGVIAAGTLAARLFGNVELPEPIVSFSWPQIYAILGFTSVLITFGAVISIDLDTGIGLWFSLLGAIALLVGAVMELLDTSTGSGPSSPGSTPPQSF